MHRLGYLIVLGFCLLIFSSVLDPGKAQSQDIDSPTAVTVKGQRLFIYYSSLDGLNPQERARRTVDKIEAITTDRDFEPGLLRIEDTPTGTRLMYGNDVLATVTIDDAKAHKSSTRILARGFANKLRSAFSEKKEELTAAMAAYAITASIVATIVLLIAAVLIFQAGSICDKKLQDWKGSKIKSIKIQKATLMSADMMANMISSVVHLIQIALMIATLYTYLLFVLEAFPSTRALGKELRTASLIPLQQAFDAFLEYLPNLFAILVIALMTYGAIGLARFFFDAMDAGTIKVSGFEQEWAKPTYKLTRLLIILFFLVMALPYAPGWESESFKQVGLLFGLLFSLGSTSVVGHIMAGTVLTYSKAFKVGDRIDIGGCTGDIIEKSMFVTRIKTPKNEVISIPNGEILNSHIINYSKMATGDGLILHTQITIGYDVPRKTVSELMVKAAHDTEHILDKPEPFVLHKELTDFSITYELNAFTHEAALMPRIYSELHEKILDQFNEAGLEILSPHFFSLRDGNTLQIPSENYPEKYQAPGFNLSLDKPASK
ncbi:MAG: mechanosensitive ion channel [Cyanobacteriota/Melainabacteria group bacterium]